MLISLRDEKNRLREMYKQMRRELDPDKKVAYDAAITKRVTGLASFRFSDTVLLYYPKSTEINTLEIAEVALKLGKKVGFPVSLDNGVMFFRLVKDLERDLADGAFGIPAPVKSCELYDKQSDNGKVILLVPALSFDVDGYRLGYGKGYYDRYISDLDACKVGLCYSDFVAKSLPRGKYDLAVDLLVTEKGVKLIGKG